MAEGFGPRLDYDLDYNEYEDYPSEEQTKDENWEQTPDGFVKPPEDETSFADLPDAYGVPMSLELREKLEEFYKHLEDKGYIVDRNAPLEHRVVFEFSPTTRSLSATYHGGNSKRVYITLQTNANKFYSPISLASDYGKGGTQFVRDVLGIKNWKNPIEKMPPKAEASLAKASKTIASTNSSPERPEDIEMQTIETVEENLTNFLEASAQTELELGPPGSLPFRELAGLDRSLRNMRTTVLKLTSDREVKKLQVKKLKDEISKVSYDDGEVQFDENLQEKTEKIKTLEEEIEVLDSEIHEYDGKFRSQFQRIKQTIDKMLHQDLTLGEQIQTLFREQGITIASVITALGLAIGMIINSILSAAKSIVNPTPSPKPTPKPKPKPTPKPEPTPEPGIKGWIKQQLQKIANLLSKVADKMLIALPGIIGSVVSFVLKAASTAVGFISEHLWLLIVALVGLLYNYLSSSLSSSLSQPGLSQSPHYNRSKSNTKKRKK